MTHNTDPTNPSPIEPTPIKEGVVETAPAVTPPPTTRKVRPMFLGILGALVIAFAMAMVVFFGGNTTSPESTFATTVTGQASVSDSGMALPAGVPGENRGYLIGNPDTATVFVDVWADPQCPFCKTFHDAGDRLIDDAVESGNAAAEHYFVAFLGPGSVAASNAVACAADAGKYELFVDTMYLNQPQQGSEGYTTDLLLRFGELSQIEDMDSFTQCVNDGTYVPYVESLTEFMAEASVQGTPTVRVDGEDVNLAETTIDEFTAQLNSISVAEVEQQREAQQQNAQVEELPEN